MCPIHIRVRGGIVRSFPNANPSVYKTRLPAADSYPVREKRHLHQPCSDRLLLFSVKLDGEILHHGTDERDICVFELAHPSVVLGISQLF
jgi:hypothetical protein